MITLAIMLLILAVTDLAIGGLAASAGRSRSRPYRVGLVLLNCSLGAAALWVYTGSAMTSALLFLGSVTGTLIWVEARAATDPAANHPRLALTAVTLMLLLGGLVFPALVAETEPAVITGYFASLPWPVLGDVGAGVVLLTAASLLFLGPTGNGIVRTCLQLTRETPVAEAEQQLKGGRFIGPLERYLIFGLALAGEPTAAALVISAKSIIRFPELQSKGAAEALTATTPEGRKLPRPVDVLTEYFLLGSLLSWSLALALAMPLLAKL